MKNTYHDVVHIREDHIGLGDRIAGLIGAIEYAKNTGRRLVIMWHGAVFTRVHDVVNGFSTSFLPKIGDLDVFVPELKDKPNYKTAQDVADNHTELCKAVLEGEDVEHEAVVFRHPFAGGMFCCRDCKREPMAMIRPSDPVREMMDEFLDEYFSGKPVIGVSIRHGNGEPLGRGRSYDDEMLIDKAVHAVGRARARMGEDCPVFVATDNWRMLKMFNEYIPGSFNFKKFIPDEGKGAIHHRHPEPRAGFTGHELPAEIMLLGHCKGLIYNPSFRPEYGKVMADLEYEEEIFDEGTWPWNEKAQRDYFLEVANRESPPKGTTRCGCRTS